MGLSEEKREGEMLLFLLALVANVAAYDSIQHYLGETVVDGPYMLTSEALENNYNGVSADNFGTTTVELPGTDKHPFVPDPVNDAEGAAGSADLDRHLRKVMKLSPEDQIWAPIVYLHPEEHSGNMQQLAQEYVKTEGGQTHLGMYIGNGATRNSPEGYHSKVWGVMKGSNGYPATVQVVSLEGVKQSVFNANAYIATVLLNKGVQFPNDYKNDVYRTIDLKTTLQFYKDWLKEESYLRTDNSWKTYCAEHVTIITNVALNVPQNENDYKKIWGNEEGKELYEIARRKFAEIAGEEQLNKVWGSGIKFKPLYRRRNIRNPAGETSFGKGLAWPAQSNADIMVNFLEAYASWPMVGAHVSAATAFGFKETLVKRMGGDNPGHIGDNFDKLVGQAAVLMFAAEAMTVPDIDPATYFATKKIHFYAAMGGNPTAVDEADPRFQLASLIISKIAPFHDAIKAKAPIPKEAAYKWMRVELRPVLEQAHAVALGVAERANNGEVPRESLVVFNSPPAITHRVAIGVHRSDPLVDIVEVATAINSVHLREKTAEEKAKLAGQQEDEGPRNCSAPGQREKNPDCMSYRKLQLWCMEAQLNPCNVRKAQLIAKIKAAGLRR